MTSPMRLNTYWTVAYAFLMLDATEHDVADYALEIAVSGGIVFG